MSERIEAFLEGPTRARRRSRPAGQAQPVRVPRRPVPLDTRPDWDAALRLEDARSARYGRPCAVLVVELREVPAGAADRMARTLGSVVRHEARETDRVARVAALRFHVLLPETTAVEAEVLAGRIRDAARRELGGGQAPVVLTSGAAARRGEPLPAALERAVAALIDPDGAGERSTA